MTSLADRLHQVEERITGACRRVGRARSEVTLVAVTKSVSPTIAQGLLDLGVQDLGENRPQELWRKATAVHGPVRWHLIGHLQRNKIERTVPLVHLIHAVDSLRLLQALELDARRRGRTLEVLLQCNASAEATKQGFALGVVEGVAQSLGALKHVTIRGLMTMAAYNADPENCRATFAALRHQRDALRPLLAAPHTLEHLSMGMSNDFEIAIEEGATLVRLGTVLVEGLSEEGP
jgi:PLP dependent protein